MLTWQNLRNFFRSAAKRTSYLEFADLLCDFGVIFFYPLVACKAAWYFIAIVVLADIFRFFVRGSWYYAPSHSAAHRRNPSRDHNAAVAGCIKIIALFLLLLTKLPELQLGDQPVFLLCIRSCLWYVIIVATIVETFRCLLHTMHKYNADWLVGSGGRIGAPNWISITRIGISLIMPHIYMTQSFGTKSNLIATTVMILAIATDSVDGYIARHTNSITKVGKYLDPLGDKIIFVPNAVAFIWLLYRNSVATDDWAVLISTAIFFAIAFTRDVLFFIWFFTNGRKIPSGIGASLIDKIRMVGICAWLLSTAIALSIPTGTINLYMTILGVIMIFIVALLSAISVYVDYRRLQKALQT